MYATDPSPRFADLSERSARALLARNHVGRLAFAFKDRVDIQPIHYVYDEKWLIGRTGVGSKLVGSIVRKLEAAKAYRKTSKNVIERSGSSASAH